MECNVCGKPAVGVASSCLGAASLAYCAECLQAGREPYWLLVAALDFASSKEDLAEWVIPIVEASLEFAGKTYADLFADIAA